MSRFARITEDPEYDIELSDDEGDWEDIPELPSMYVAKKQQEEEFGPYSTINS